MFVYKCAERDDGVEVAPADGTFYIFPSFQKVIERLGWPTTSPSPNCCSTKSAWRWCRARRLVRKVAPEFPSRPA
jgi:aspartate/methionine/tyrosine aminotransferase